ncbi:hypothetical protein [Azonexus sp.]|uniref:hypothetical protein n=1 Tax=Azonexus sp. TaxID=1872668 RepID=UPI0027B93DDE|nr:hypothetical protein [Azonexus sp.]
MATIPGGLFVTAGWDLPSNGGVRDVFNSLVTEYGVSVIQAPIAGSQSVTGAGFATPIGNVVNLIAGGSGVTVLSSRQSFSPVDQLGHQTIVGGAGSDSILGGNGLGTLVGGTTGDSVVGSVSSKTFLAGKAGDPVTVYLNQGILSVGIQAPPGVSFSVSTPPQGLTPAKAVQHLNSQMHQAQLAAEAEGVTNTAEFTAYRESFDKAVAVLTALAPNPYFAASIVSFSTTNNGRSSADVDFVASNPVEGMANLFTFVLGGIQAGSALNISNVDNAMLVGGGKVVVVDNNATRVFGDLSDQTIVGGGGSDTLVGGGGSDTLVGGSGADSFGFNEAGHYRIDDFSGSVDRLVFDSDIINSLSDLAPFLTSARNVNGNAVFEFVHGQASITLVGISVEEVTSEMVNFNFG